MDLKFTETSKGKPAALLDGHLFPLMSESKSSGTWRCTQKDCKARFTTTLNTTDILHGMTSHCHGKTEDSVSLKKLQLRQSCKRKGGVRFSLISNTDYCNLRKWNVIFELKSSTFASGMFGIRNLRKWNAPPLGIDIHCKAL